MNAETLSELSLPETEDSAEELPACVLTLQHLDETPLSSYKVRDLKTEYKILESVRKYIVRG